MLPAPDEFADYPDPSSAATNAFSRPAAAAVVYSTSSICHT